MIYLGCTLVHTVPENLQNRPQPAHSQISDVHESSLATGKLDHVCYVTLRQMADNSNWYPSTLELLPLANVDAGFPPGRGTILKLWWPNDQKFLCSVRLQATDSSGSAPLVCHFHMSPHVVHVVGVRRLWNVWTMDHFSDTKVGWKVHPPAKEKLVRAVGASREGRISIREQEIADGLVPSCCPVELVYLAR
jgi:hypothetical protein